MSNIPRARRVLGLVRNDLVLLVNSLSEAIKDLDRIKPAFRAKAIHSKLTLEQTRRAREMRKRGIGIADIAMKLNTNSGRVSEALHRRGRPNGS